MLKIYGKYLRCVLLLSISINCTILITYGRENNDHPSTSTIRHQSGIKTTIKSILMDDEIRKNQIEENLKYRSGKESQVLRILCWARESESELRKELLIQWLLEKEILPQKEITKKTLGKIIIGFNQQEINVRMEEIEKIYSIIEEERKNRITLAKTSGPSGIELLDQLKESFILHYNDTANRREAYEKLPLPRDFEEGDWIYGSLYILLWLTEQDKSIRESLLVPRINESGVTTKYETRNVFFEKRVQPFLNNLKGSEKVQRYREMNIVIQN